MSVLITGGAGRLGVAVTSKLLERGHKVVAYDLVPQPKTRAHLGREIEFVQGSILDFPYLIGTMTSHDVDRIVHLAAFLQFASEEDPRKGIEINVNGTLNVLESARIVRAKKIVFASSVGAYGSLAQEVYTEDMAVRPDSLYGVAKLLCEKLGERYSRLYGIDFTALRFGSGIYAPQQAATPGMAEVIGSILSIISGARVEISAVSGSTKGHFTYVEDVADGILAALFSENLPQMVYNIAGPEDSYVSYDDFVAAIREICPQSGEVAFHGLKKRDRGRLDVSRAKEDMGYSPRYSLKQGLAECIRVMKAAE